MRHLLLITLASLCIAAAPVSQPAVPVDQKCRKILADWRERFEKERLNAIISTPYVIAGDGSRARLSQYRDHTVVAATRALQASLFDKKLDEPVLILLFESAEPYQRLSKKWFDDTPDTPFGYFRRDGIMVMNVGTGTGTLVHELVHALIKPDFPHVPDWLNEGLGSLYEQCSIDDNTINGLPNWRLPALQRAIRAGKLRPLRELIEDKQFYADPQVGMNYAQARYLLLYLQHKRQLADFYKRARDNHESDVTGLTTLKDIIALQSLDEFEKDWRRWVLTLRFQ